MLCDPFVEARLVKQSIAFYLVTNGEKPKVQEAIQILEIQAKRSNSTMMADATVAF